MMKKEKKQSNVVIIKKNNVLVDNQDAEENFIKLIRINSNEDGRQIKT